MDHDVAIGVLDDDFPSLSMKDEFLKSFLRKTMEDLQACEEDDFFIVLGTIVSIIDDKWWYLACSCNKSVNDDDDKYYCTSCATYVTDVTPRYKLKLLVCDGYDTTTFICFDAHCRALLNKTCEEMISTSKKTTVESGKRDFDEISAIDQSIEDSEKDFNVYTEGASPYVLSIHLGHGAVKSVDPENKDVDNSPNLSVVKKRRLRMRSVKIEKD
ncbi:hypothetical protein SESBI_08989 [Sesbania bispinosa]|nr:hypothetical protein SESBI_08989 [Sesbania bispinosa]